MMKVKIFLIHPSLPIRIYRNSFITGSEYGVYLINNGVLINFEPRNIFLQNCMERGVRQYDKSAWMTLGPNTYTATYLESPTSLRESEELNVMPDQFFHPIRGGTFVKEYLNPWAVFVSGLSTSASYFDPGRSEQVEKQLKEAYTLHLFSSSSSHFKVTAGFGQPLEKIAKQHCPISFEYSKFF